MVVVLWVAFFLVRIVDHELTEQNKKLHNLNSFSELIRSKVQPYDFILDAIDLGICGFLAKLSAPGIMQTGARIILFLAVIATLVDIARWFFNNGRE